MPLFLSFLHSCSLPRITNHAMEAPSPYVMSDEGRESHCESAIHPRILFNQHPQRLKSPYHRFKNLPARFIDKVYRIMKIFRKNKQDRVSPYGPAQVYRKSKFTENFSEDGLKPVERKSKFTEHFDISMTDQDMQAMCTTAPCESAHLEKSKPAAAHPINRADLALKSSSWTPPSKSAAETAYPSPMSVYSRASTDSKPFVPIGESSESSRSRSPGQLKAFFVFQDGDDICDTRHIFGDAAVDAKTLVDTLEVLTGKGSAKTVRDINCVRSTLSQSSQAKAANTDAHNSSRQEKDIGAYWSTSQKTWRKHAKAILEKERVSIINGYIEDPAIGSAESATAEKKHRDRSNGTKRATSESSVDFWDEVEAPGKESPIIEFEIGEQEWRGRSPTAKHVTAVRGCKSG